MSKLELTPENLEISCLCDIVFLAGRIAETISTGLRELSSVLYDLSPFLFKESYLMATIKDYEYLSQLIYWKDGMPYYNKTTKGHIKKDKLAGTMVKGRRRIGIKRNGKFKGVYAYRLHYYMVYGYLPQFIDHIDRDIDNNRIENLRPCTHSQNMRNQAKRANCSSIYIGVQWHKQTQKWRSTITISKGKRKHVGYFTCEIEAAKAYDKAIVENGLNDFSPLNFQEAKNV